MVGKDLRLVMHLTPMPVKQPAASGAAVGFVRVPVDTIKDEKERPKMNLTAPQAVLTGSSLIALAILFQPTITQLFTQQAQAQSALSPDHEILKSDHEMMKTTLKNIAFAIEHIPACK